MLSFLVAGAALAGDVGQDIEFHQSVDRNDVGTDDTFRLTIVLGGAPEGAVPTFPKFGDFGVVSRSDTTQMSYSFSGGGPGVTRRAHHCVLTLRANRSGRFTIPASVLVTADKTYRTAPIPISVHRGRMAEASPRPPREWPTMEADAAESEIRKASGFWGIVIGLDGDPTPAVVGYRSLLKAPDGLERFHRLMRTSGIAGQLYALCGLYLLEPKAFGAELALLWDANPDTRVEVGLYDGSTEQPVRDVLGASKPYDDNRLGLASGARCRALATQPLPTQ
jgi:hypothetical protein